MTELPTRAQGAATVPAKDPEPGVAVLRLPWWRWPYVIVPLVALVMLLGGAAWAFPGLLARLQLRDYRTSERQVQEFAWPAELHDDPTFTACGGFATRCARADIGPDAALAATAQALAAAGVHLGPVGCGAATDTSPWLRTAQEFDCTAVAHAGGYSVHALATRFAFSPSSPVALPLGYTQVSVALVAENPQLGALVQLTPATSAPLPLHVTDVPGLPAVFEQLTCSQPEGDGCRTFAGTITLADPNAAGLDALAAQLADDLRGGGYLVDFESCRDVDAGRRCTVGGKAFRTAGGNDLTSVLAILSLDAAGGPTVLANVSAL
jgi:hypothetical protein